MEIYNNNFVIIHFFREHLLIKTTWLPSTGLMTDEQCKECFIVVRDITKRFKPTRIINDTSKMAFSIHPVLQEWIDQLMYPVMMEIGLQKMAFVMSENFTVQIGIEQAVEEITNPIFENRYFNSIAEAEAWILEDCPKANNFPFKWQSILSVILLFSLT